MRQIRIYADVTLREGNDNWLAGPPAHHLLRVLRLKRGAEFRLFNGDGFDYPLRITTAERDRLSAEWRGVRIAVAAPHRYVEMAPVLLKGERMDWVLQKAVELGVSSIAPLFSERCEVHVDSARAARRLAHWRGVVIAACEQCGRAELPKIRPPEPLADYLAGSAGDLMRIALVPGAAQALCEVAGDGPVALLVGPEGGFTAEEARQLQGSGAALAGLGPRTLRADTASLASLAIVMAQVWAAENT